MVEPDKIRGYIGAHDQIQKPKEDVTDPEKFKKILKVESSTEAEKREQRKKKRSEHEGTTEEEADIGPKTPENPTVETEFSQVLKDEPDKEDLLTGQTSGESRKTPLSTSEADLSYEEEKGQGLRKTIFSVPQQPVFEEEAPSEAPAPEAASPPPLPSQQTPETPPPPPSSPSPEPTTSKQSPPPQEKQGPMATGNLEEPMPTLAKRRKAHKKAALEKTKASMKMEELPPEKKKVETFKEKKLREKYDRLEKAHKTEHESHKAAAAPSEKEAVPTPLKEKPLPDEKTKSSEKQPLSHVKKESFPESQMQATAPPKKELPHEMPEQIISPPAPTEEIAQLPVKGTLRPLKKEPVHTTSEKGKPSLQKTTQQKEGEPGKEKKEQEKDTESLLDEIAASYQAEKPITAFAPVEAESPPESKLAPEVYELYEKMVGLVTIQKVNGVERTTVTIDLKGSLFDGAELILDRSETAQDTFNIELKASPEAVALFNQNVSDLVAAFQKKDFDFRVNIKKASLQKRYAVQKKKDASSS